jgi:hypothetical protein
MIRKRAFQDGWSVERPTLLLAFTEKVILHPSTLCAAAGETFGGNLKGILQNGFQDFDTSLNCLPLITSENCQIAGT